MQVVHAEPIFIKLKRNLPGTGATGALWEEWTPLQIPNGAYHVQAPMKHRIVCKTARLSMPSNDHNNLTKPTKAGCSWPYHTMYVEAQQARALSSAWNPTTGAHPHKDSMLYSKKFAQMIFHPRFSMDEATGWGGSFAPTNPTIGHEFLWECIRDDDAFSFELQLGDANALQLRIADAEEHSLTQLAMLGKDVSGWSSSTATADVEVTFEMACVYEQYTVPQDKPNHPHGAFNGYYKTAITDQHGV